MDHQHHHHAPAGADTAALAEILDLDTEVLHAYLSDVTGWVRGLAGDLPHGRILDLGTGTGAGTFALLPRFAGAEVVAVDMSAEMLEHLRDKARNLGVLDRIHPIQADLDTTWPAIEPVDLVWAANSLHHMADPDRVLAEVFAAIHPGGLIVLAEMDSFPRFLPDDLGIGNPGLEARCHALLAEGIAHDVPYLGADWGPRLTTAGFAIEAERRFAIDLTPPLPPSAGRYAEASLRRLRAGLDGRMNADDQATLDTLIDSDGPEGIARRADLGVRSVRTVWVARRP